MDSWPFSDPPDVVVFTTKDIFDGAPIRRVCHDEDDGGWQFLTGGPVSMSDALLVSLKNIFTLDQSIAELADLPLGWLAVRDQLGSPWKRMMRTDSA